MSYSPQRLIQYQCQPNSITNMTSRKTNGRKSECCSDWTQLGILNLHESTGPLENNSLFLEEKGIFFIISVRVLVQSLLASVSAASAEEVLAAPEHSCNNSTNSAGPEEGNTSFPSPPPSAYDNV
ncbi:hypothetical protein GOODEAATRI_032749, partial [Goodea atripinnis]